MKIRALLASSLLLVGCAELIPAPTTAIVPASPPALVPPPAPLMMEPPPALPSMPPPAADARMPTPPTAVDSKREAPAAQLYHAKPDDPEAVEFGMINQVKTPVVPRPKPSGDDPLSAKANVWGEAIDGARGPGAGPGAGSGSGTGPTGGTNRKRPPQIRMGAASVTGSLPPEVIRGIVSKNLARLRLCYEGGLKVTPTLYGGIRVRFAIGRDGATTVATNGGSDLYVIGKDGAPTSALPNKMVDCVVKAFKDLKYPAPDGGVVMVVYPIEFQPE
jgi:hypothetical protein